MSDKKWSMLNPLDRELRQACVDGPKTEGVQVTIEKVCGFELFNTRPYHNYETWGSGYRVMGQGITVSREDLDDAVLDWTRRVKERREKEE